MFFSSFFSVTTFIPDIYTAISIAVLLAETLGHSFPSQTNDL